MSLQGHNCCEIFVTNFGWSPSSPMKTVSDVHETLDLFLGRYGIPEALISDGARSYTGGEFKKKAKQAGIFCKLTDPYSPRQNSAESEIREVKRLVTMWQVRSRSPRRLWDHAVQLALIFCSHLALDIYKLDGQVPETKMLGQTADISFICGFAWYDRIYFNESIAGFPEPNMQHGRYLCPTDPEAVSVLTRKNSEGPFFRNFYSILRKLLSTK
jgi:hypothetical protein